MDLPLTLATVCTLLGPDWQTGSKVFVGDSRRPLQPDETRSATHGLLVRIFRPRLGVLAFHSLAERLRAPLDFFSILEVDGPLLLSPPSQGFGLLQPLVVDKLVHYSPGRGPFVLDEVLASHADSCWGEVRICWPRTAISDFQIRGTCVGAVAGAFPARLAGRVPVFIDARDIDQSLRLVASKQGHMPLSVFLDLTGTFAAGHASFIVGGSVGFDPATRCVRVLANDLVVLGRRPGASGDALSAVPSPDGSQTPPDFGPGGDAHGTSSLAPSALAHDTIQVSCRSPARSRSPRGSAGNSGTSCATPGGPGHPEVVPCLPSLHWPHSTQQELQYRLALSEMARPPLVFDEAEGAPPFHIAVDPFLGPAQAPPPPQPVDTDPEHTIPAMNNIAVRIFCFQRPVRRVSLWYHLGESVHDLLVRAEILHNFDPQFMQLLPLSPHPPVPFLALLYVPRWWDAVPITSLLLDAGQHAEGLFVHTAFPAESFEDALPPSLLQHAASVALFAAPLQADALAPLRPDNCVQDALPSGALVAIRDSSPAIPCT